MNAARANGNKLYYYWVIRIKDLYYNEND